MSSSQHALAEREGKTKILLLLTSILFVLSTETLASNLVWTTPASGFYESTSNWTPNRVPGPSDVAIFGMPVELQVGFLGDQTVGGLIFGNNSSLTLRPAGSNPTDQTLTVLGDTVITDATVDLSRSSGGAAELYLDNQGRLIVDGDLSIRDSATVLSETGEIGLEASHVGNVAVTGTSPDGSVSFWRVPQLHVGVAGNGNLSVDDGGVVASGESRIGHQIGSTGHAIVAGSDEFGNRSRWSTGVLSVGSRGEGSLAIESGGIVSSLNGRVGSTGLGHVAVIGAGTNGTPSTWDVNRLLTVGPLGNGSIVVDRGGHVSAPTVSFMSGEIDVSGTDEIGNASLFSSTSLSVGTSGLAEVNVVRGGRLTSESAAVGYTSDGSGEVQIRNLNSDLISSWLNPGNVYVGGSRFGRSGNGQIDVGRNGLFDVGETLTIWSSGAVTVDRGQLVADSIDTTDGGDLNLLSGELSVNNFRGDLTNQGTFMRVNNVSGRLLNQSGVLAPGPGASSTTIEDSFTQYEAATISLDIGGRGPGTSHDLVGISGAAVIGGQLRLNLINDFAPDPSDEFTMLGADSMVGLFDNVATGHRLATSDGGGSFVVHYGLGSAMEENRLVAYNFLATDALLGDFDQNGTLEAADIDRLTRAVGGTDLGFDLVYDAVINDADRKFWVEEIMLTYFGDANLDGEFNSTDFIQVFQRNEYEDSLVGNSDWADGDWNGDGDFDSSDFVVAFQSGGYETGPRGSHSAFAHAAAIVPEPLSCVWLAYVILAACSRKMP